MQLERHLEAVKAGVQNAAALADEQSQDIARRLGDALESTVRLAMIESLSEAATEISADLAPGSVEFRLSGGEPQFIVTAPPAEAPATAEPVAEAEPEPSWTPSDEDEEQVRVTLRLPASVKAQVDERADADGVSTNTWLLQLVLRELGRRRNRGGLDEQIESSIASSLEAAFGAIPWGGRPPRAPQPPTPPVPPFPPGFPFNDERRGANRRGPKQFRGWAQ